MNLTIPLPISCKELSLIIKTFVFVLFVVCMFVLFSDVNSDIKIIALLVGVISGFTSFIMGIVHIVEKGSPIKFRCRCDQ